MIAPACGSCTAPVGDGAVLCSGCTRDLAVTLLTAASIAPDLDDAVARLLRRGGGKSSETSAPLPVDLAASDVKGSLGLLLGRWASLVLKLPYRRDDPWPEDGIAGHARWLTARLAVLRQQPEAPVLLGFLRHHVSRALAVIDRLPERAPAGQCDNCGRQLLAEIGADTVRCGCGMTALALNDRRRERAAAADVLGTPQELSAVMASIGVRVKPSTISSWGTRKLIEKRPGGYYRLSDALAMAARRSEVRG